VHKEGYPKGTLLEISGGKAGGLLAKRKCGCEDYLQVNLFSQREGIGFCFKGRNIA
jgi:hypothetical protein